MVLTPGWNRLRGLSDAGGDGSRQVFHPAHRELLSPAADRFCGLFSGRLALPVIGPRWESQRRAWRPSQRIRRSAPSIYRWCGGFCKRKMRLVPSRNCSGCGANFRRRAQAGRTGCRAKCIEMRDFVVKIRSHTAMQFAAPVVKGLPPGSQALLDWKLREFASHRRDSDPQGSAERYRSAAGCARNPEYPGLHQEAAPRWAALSAKARADDPDLVVPAAERKPLRSRVCTFCFGFPGHFLCHRSAAVISRTIRRTRDVC